MRILDMIIDNGLYFPIFQPEIPGSLAVVFIDAAIAFFPAVEFAAGDPNPADKAGLGQFGTPGPMLNKINNCIADIMGNPGIG
jgi:hypothetical protein